MTGDTGMGNAKMLESEGKLAFELLKPDKGVPVKVKVSPHPTRL